VSLRHGASFPTTRPAILAAFFRVACRAEDVGETTGESQDELSAIDFSFALRANAECGRQFFCSPVPTTQWFGRWSTPSECVATRVAELRKLAATPGIRLSMGKQLQCADAVQAMTCFDWVRASMRGTTASLVEACTLPATGTLPNSAPCQTKEQCASGVCQFNLLPPAQQGGGMVSSRPSDCGTCVERRVVQRAGAEDARLRPGRFLHALRHDRLRARRDVPSHPHGRRALVRLPGEAVPA